MSQFIEAHNLIILIEQLGALWISRKLPQLEMTRGEILTCVIYMMFMHCMYKKNEGNKISKYISTQQNTLVYKIL